MKTGRVIAGRYRLGARLGSGTMGEVYAAKDTDGSDAAIKLLHAHLVDIPDMGARFAREALHARHIRSPFVARVLAAGEDGSRAWIATERLFGETLEARLARERALPIESVNDVIVAVLQGLADVHAFDVVHRDLKPSNIFLEAAPAGPRVRLLDFGLSKHRPSPDPMSEPSLTSVVDTLGTFSYMPPEQFGDAAGADERADLYAAAVVLFRMLTGARPFPGRSQHVLLQQKLCMPPRTLRDVTGARWPEVADAFFSCALAADREERFANARAMLQAWRHRVRGRSFPHPRAFDAAVVRACDEEAALDACGDDPSATERRP